MKYLLLYLLLLLALSGSAFGAETFSVGTDTNGLLKAAANGRSTNFFETNWYRINAAASARGMSNVNIQALQATNPIAWDNLYIGNIVSGVYNAWAIQTATNAAGEQIFSIYNDDLIGNALSVIENSGTVRTLLNNGAGDSTTNHGSFYSDSVLSPSISSGVGSYRTNFAATNATIGGTNLFAGSIAHVPRTYISLVNGDNADIEPGTNTLTILSGATTTANIHGFLAKEDYRDVTVLFSGAASYVIYNESGSEGTAARKILTSTGGNITLTNAPASIRILYYSSRWHVIEKSN